ncbi:hypothetical protein BHM03_00031093 [Ensete ventricosum]|nr:hypothetical protein BHM03_00031093 [Ensete ventricosum]
MGRPSKRVKIAVRKHKSRRGKGGSHVTTWGKELVASAEEDSSSTHCRSRSMKDLCSTRVCKGDEGYYVLQIVDSMPKDSNSTMRARWSNMTYLAKVWDDSQAASEFRRGVLHPNLAKELYTLPFNVLMARALKQIMLIALLDRVHDAGRLVTLMGNRASHLEAEIEKLKSEGNLEQLAMAEQRAIDLRANYDKVATELGEGT